MTASHKDELLRNMIRAFAQYERSLIRARTKAALAAKKARGGRVGYHHAFGHTAEERAAIARMGALHAEEMSLRAIARQLEEEGFKARGKRWHAQTVRRCLAAQAV